MVLVTQFYFSSVSMTKPLKANEDEEEMKPKRPFTAYNYVFKSERARPLGYDEDELDYQQKKKRKHRKTRGMSGFEDLRTTWMAADPRPLNAGRRNRRYLQMDELGKKDIPKDDVKFHNAFKDLLQSLEEVNVAISTRSY